VNVKVQCAQGLICHVSYICKVLWLATYHSVAHPGFADTEHRVQVQKLPISDLFCKIDFSSLNTHLICIILCAFELHEHSQDNPPFKNAKILFFGLGRTYKEYFRR
jgi:hypothetical protein